MRRATCLLNSLLILAVICFLLYVMYIHSHQSAPLATTLHWNTRLSTASHTDDTQTSPIISHISNSTPAISSPQSHSSNTVFVSQLEQKSDLSDSFLESFKSGYIYSRFTIVMPTYKRTENLFLIMDQYCGMGDIIDMILILWNNIGRPIPPDLTSRAEKCEIPVVIRVMEKNNLTSRFFPYSQIRTAGVMSLDDDNLIPKSSLELAFRTFQKYPYRLVGYDARGFSVSNKRYRYSFKSHPYTVILTNRAIIHHKYLKLFSNIPKKVMDFVVEHKNGEDLAMNVVIGAYLKEVGRSQCVGVHVKTETKALNNYSKENYGGLSRRSSHINDRHECFQLLAEEYGNLHDFLPECTLVISDTSDL